MCFILVSFQLNILAQLHVYSIVSPPALSMAQTRTQYSKSETEYSFHVHSKAANTAKWSANNELKVEDCVWQLSLKSPFNCRMALSIPDFDSADSSYSKCSMYDVNYTEVMSSGIKKADPSWPIKACQHGWEFNFTEVPYSTVATDVRIYSNVTRK